VRTVASAEHGGVSVDGKRSSRSTDTRSRWTYATAGGIYFELTAFPDYGRLSGRTNVLRGDPVSRLDANPHKRNAGDFVLCKTRKPGEAFWASQLGDGRPGWHIEDTAISERLLRAVPPAWRRDRLIFPHHEAETTQMETISGLRPMVGYWLHTGLLTTSDSKMSKSLGNFVTIRDALAAASARAMRFAFFRSHYRDGADKRHLLAGRRGTRPARPVRRGRWPELRRRGTPDA
jgi:cysteinyl-tRNA synthetase